MLSILMVIPAVTDILAGNTEWTSFFIAAFLTAFVGICLVLTNQGDVSRINIKQTFLLATSTLLSIAFFGSLPFWFSELNLSFTDSFFESMSGITTTGSTILVGLDDLPPGILLWRSMLQFCGGIYTIVISLTVLPVLQIGGMQIFRSEGSEAPEKVIPRTAQISLAIASVYLMLTTLCGLSLWLFGMDGFDAINHAMTTISTGGFSTHDKSIMYFNSKSIEYTIALFMVLSCIPFVLYVKALRGDLDSIINDSQIRWLLRIIIFCIVVVTTWLVLFDNFDSESAVRYATFNIISIISTTGFASTDYAIWGALTLTLIFQLSVIGGCAGSTTGGIKIFRYQVLYYTSAAQISNMIRPNAVLRPKFNGQAIAESTTSSVMNYFILFAFCFMAIAILLSLFDIDYISAMSSAAANMANLGPGLGDKIGPMGNYSSLADPPKWLLCFAMLIGRLEVFTVLVLFSKHFWKS
jgi:trk system potassium uptake protein TrkH